MTTYLTESTVPDWESRPIPTSAAPLCPSCRRHIRLVAVRERDDMAKTTTVSYYVSCPNKCVFRTDGYGDLTALDADGRTLERPIIVATSEPDKRLACGRRADVSAALTAWTMWVKDHAVPPLDADRHVLSWPDATECPVCHAELIVDETFMDKAGVERVGCPEHPTIASTRVTIFDPNRQLDLLRRHIAPWGAWLRDHHCPICGEPSRLEVNPATGMWTCTCGCANIDNPATGYAKPVDAINAWRKDRDDRINAINELNTRITIRTREAGELRNELTALLTDRGPVTAITLR